MPSLSGPGELPLGRALRTFSNSCTAIEAPGLPSHWAARAGGILALAIALSTASLEAGTVGLGLKRNLEYFATSAAISGVVVAGEVAEVVVEGGAVEGGSDKNFSRIRY